MNEATKDVILKNNKQFLRCLKTLVRCKEGKQFEILVGKTIKSEFNKNFQGIFSSDVQHY